MAEATGPVILYSNAPVPPVVVMVTLDVFVGQLSGVLLNVKSVGGSIMDNRVAGGLAITRALGDQAYKNFGVTSTPYVVRHVIRPFDKYLILASDGVWDTLTDQQAVDCC